MPSAQIAAPVLRAKCTSEPISATLAGSAFTSATSARSSLMMSAAHAHHLLQAGVALPRVVHRDARAAGAQRVEVALEPLHVEHPLLLGDLEHDAAQVARQPLADVRRRQRRRAQVDRQERARRAVVGRQRGAHGLGLERGPEPEAVRLREPPRRRQAGLALEARQRLVADRLAAGQRHDRLEHRSHGLGPRDQGGEVLALLLGHDEDVLGVVAARAPAAALLGPLQRARRRAAAARRRSSRRRGSRRCRPSSAACR